MQDRASPHLLLAIISHLLWTLERAWTAPFQFSYECQNPLCSLHYELQLKSFLQPKWFVKDTCTVNSQRKEH